MCGRLYLLIKLAAVVSINSGVAQAAGGENKAAAHALCNIYNQGLSLEKYQNTSFPNQIRRMLDEIEKINMSALPDEIFTAKHTAEYTEDQWKDKVQSFGAKFVTTDGVEHIFRRLNGKPAASTASRKFLSILRKAKKIESEVDAAVKEVNSKREAAKTSMRNALYGDGNEAPKAESFSETRAASCGDHSSEGQPGTGSGKSVINDLVCLCALGGANGNTASAPDGKACTDNGAAIGSKAAWNSGAGATALAAWNTDVKQICGKESDVIASSSSITSALDRYATFIKAGTTGKGFIVGHSNSDSGLCAQSNARTHCVAYPQADKSATTVPDGKGAPAIGWVKKVRQAALDLDEAKDEMASLNDLQARVTALHQAAWNIYIDLENEEDVNSISNQYTMNQSQKGNPSTLTDKTTAQGPGAVNSATIHRFILPWALLI